ncbi:MAG: type 1 glutamine amidotransferase [Rhodobacteraceae bacterium]|jgi:GMP synthase-like glutamine amidotransferase|nr:type 1 glutamine amidotransferase [Paracoccaceae bacterium]
MHIALIDTNTDLSDFGQSHPSEVQKFRALLAPHAPDWRLTGFRAPDGALPPDITAFDGMMISGSIASVNDPDAWVGEVLDLVREAVARNVPVFGACFGHQAIAKALGGTVGYNPQGWVLGRYETHNHSPAPWMDHLGPMALTAAHKEQVLVPPPGAAIHAGTEAVPNGHLSLGNTVFSTQYHPELDAPFMHGLFDVMEGSVDPDTLAQARAGMDGPLDSDQFARWIVAFFEQAQHRAAP